MAIEFARSARKAKGRALKLDTSNQSVVWDITTIATTGTFGSAASTANGLTITVNGTNYKIPLFSSP
jgi:hypothetical protein